MTTYTVTVSRAEPWWVAVVAGVPAGAPEARRQDQLEGEVGTSSPGLTVGGPLGSEPPGRRHRLDTALLDWQLPDDRREGRP